jgi:hypothetical protein
VSLLGFVIKLAEEVLLLAEFAHLDMSLSIVSEKGLFILGVLLYILAQLSI